MNPWRGLRKLPREAWVVAVATLINRSGTMVFPLLIYYLPEKLNYSPEQTSIALALFGIGSFLTAPLGGWLSDKIGAHRIMKLSLLLSGVILLIYPLVQSFPLVITLTLAWTITSEAFRPASYAILTTVVKQPDRQRETEDSKKVQALSRLAINLGMAVGPLVGGILATYSYTLLFLLDGGTSILAFLYLTTALRPTEHVEIPSLAHHTSADAIMRSAGERAITDRRFLLFLAAIMPVLIIFFQAYSSIPRFMEIDLNLGKPFYTLLISINAALVIVLEVPLNTAISGWPHRQSVMLGAFLCAVGFGALTYANSFLYVAVTVVIWTFGEMLLLPSMVAYVGSIAPVKRQGEYMGVYSMIFSLTMSLAPVIGIMTFERLGSTVLWSGAFIFGCLSVLMLGKAIPLEQVRRGGEVN